VNTGSGWVEAPGEPRLREVAASGLEVPDAEPIGHPQFGPLLDHPGKLICVWRNYGEHARELGNPESAWPETFLRLPSTLIGPGDEIRVPAVSTQVDYEGELALVIGKGGRHIPASRAEQHVFGYTIANDVTVRDWQWRGQQFTPGKNFDGTLPVGPDLVTADELDWRGLRLETRLNGETVQSATTDQLIFDVPALIEFISSWTTLEPGDLILTGTPAGVGAGRKPPLWLKPGDVVEVEIEGIGSLRNPVVRDERAVATDRWSQIAGSER
jgi:acylpyruvate hydrolase